MSKLVFGVGVANTVEIIQPSGVVARVSTTEQGAGLCPMTYANMRRFDTLVTFVL